MRFWHFQLLALVAVSALVAFWPLVAFAQDAGAAAQPVVDPLFADLGELVQHAKLGRTVLAVIAAVVLVVRLTLRFGARIPGAVGVWLSGPQAALVLPLVIGVLGGVSTTLSKGGTWYDGLIGGIVIAVGSWLPMKPAAPTGPTPAQVGDAAAGEVKSVGDAVKVFAEKGPNP